jgi:hypothetical protein
LVRHLDADGSRSTPQIVEIRVSLRRTHDPGPVKPEYPVTPDGRYFVVRGRLWRMADPTLPADRREALVRQLMDARRALRGQRTEQERAAARRQVDDAKRSLGERGPVWWSDGAPDFNRKLVKNTPYLEWFASLDADDDASR